MFQKTLTGGRYNESNYPVQELWRKRGGGGRIFEGGVLAGHYGIQYLFRVCPVMRLVQTQISGTSNGMVSYTYPFSISDVDIKVSNVH